MRLLTAVRELSPRPATIALLTPVDLDGPVARAADRIVVLPAPNGRSATAAYLDLDAVMRALDEAEADAVWVGWGFLAENAEFCRRVEASGRTFIGPTPEVLALTGDKVRAKELAESVAVPVVPWSRGFVGTIEDARAMAEMIGFPIIVKASAGGGGRGIRVAGTAADLDEAFVAASTEAERGFGDGRVFVEACVRAARHLEVQIAGDGRGGVVAFGIRDCTTQRRHQKVIEECPGPFTTPELRAALEAHALQIAKALSYRSLGTFEFIADVDPTSPRFGQVFFMEINPRLQVEHTVTEEVFGIDLVKLQLALARGDGLPASVPEPRGAAVQLRLCAEDPERGDVPAPGRVASFKEGRGPGVRIDAAIETGLVIPPDFDSMIAKVIARGADRDEALARVAAALQQTTCLIEDGATNKSLLLDVLAHHDFRSGNIDTRWLDRVRVEKRLKRYDLASEALVVAALASYRAQRAADEAAFYETLARGIPQRLPSDAGHTFQLGLRGRHHAVTVRQVAAHHYIGTTSAGSVALTFEDERGRIVIGERVRVVRHHLGPRGIVVELDDQSVTVERDAGGVLRAPAPALVIALDVRVGDVVGAGQRLATLESMKLEMPLRAPEAGRVVKLFAHPNATLAKDDPIVMIEPLGEVVAAAGDALPPLAPSPDWVGALLDDGRPDVGGVAALDDDALVATHAALVAEVDTLLLGWDLDAQRAAALVALLSDASLWDTRLFRHAPRTLVDRLASYADLVWLSSDRPLRGVPDAPVVSMETAFWIWARHHARGAEAVRVDFRAHAQRAMAAYGIDDFNAPELRAALVRMAGGAARTSNPAVQRLVVALLQLAGRIGHELKNDRRLERALLQLRELDDDARLPVADEAAHAHYLIYRRPRFAERARELDRLDPKDLARLIEAPVGLSSPLARAAIERDDPTAKEAFAYRLHTASLPPRMAFAPAHALAHAFPQADEVVTWVDGDGPTFAALAALPRPAGTRLVVCSDYCSMQVSDGIGHVHPEVADRLGLERWAAFDFERLPSPEGIFALLARARDQREDERIVVFAELKDVYWPGALLLGSAPGSLFTLEHGLREAMSTLRRLQSMRGRAERLHANEILLAVRPAVVLPRARILELADSMPIDFRALGLDRLVLRGMWAEPGEVPVLSEAIISMTSGHRLEVRFGSGREPIAVATPYQLKVRRTKRFDVLYPYEIIRLLTSEPDVDTPERLAFPHGTFQEWDLDADGRATPIDRPPGHNTSAIVFGLVTHHTDKHPEGMPRVLVMSDPLRGMGALAEPECRRLIAAMDLAAKEHLPLEWVPVSSGAKIAMDSGTENLDWTARVLRRIIELTRDRSGPNAGVMHLLVDGVNVGAQSYFDAEATMLGHCRGALIMTRRGALVLTGKKALDVSGGVSAADERGIGGFERIMGPNGEAQYFADDLAHAFRLLLRIYDLTYVQPREHRPRKRPPVARGDVMALPYPSDVEGGFATIGDIFSAEHNRERKRPFDIRAVMRVLLDDAPLERWAEMADADTAVVWDAHLGGHPITMVGFESRPLPRHGAHPGDGPTIWTAATLFPRSSKKVARALNAASGNRPVVVVANLSGFDGSPESMREQQLEWGAEIGRAVVAFDGPILFYVVGRYHGGAYVVFSKALNDDLYAAALEGSYASVIGGAPAAAVVFPREVRARTQADARVVAARHVVDEAAVPGASQAVRQAVADHYREVWEHVHAEKLGEVAKEFDERHSIGRALGVGSIDAVVHPRALREHITVVLNERG